MPQGLRIVVAGGGTGGHLYPGIAIVERIRERVHDAEVLFIGARGGMEEQILARSGFRSTLISGRGLRGASFLTKLASPFVVAAAVVRAMSVIRQFRADLVIGTGGYASAAAVIAAVVLRVPRVLQEQNSIPGMVNRRLARFADVMLLSYESSAKWLPSSVRTCVVGNPLRHMPVVERAPAAAHFGLAANTPTVLVIGGSRGARSLNRAATAAAGALVDVQFLILAGAGDISELENAVDAKRVKVVEYADDVWTAYAMADVAVARAGASTVFELSAFAVPTIFVPYPYAADDHQAHNIAPLVESGAAETISDAALNGDQLTNMLRALIGDGVRRRSMSDKMAAWSRPDAAQRAADVILELAKKKGHRALEAVPVTSR